jgi:hypothetical protein
MYKTLCHWMYFGKFPKIYLCITEENAAPPPPFPYPPTATATAAKLVRTDKSERISEKCSLKLCQVTYIEYFF